jgi:hypothetical protein
MEGDVTMKVKAIAVAALLSVAAPAVVLAQAQAPATPGNQSAAPAAGAAMSAPTDFNAFLQGFEGADFTSATSGIDTATSFNVVKLSTLPNADAAKLQTAIEPHQADIASLSTQIGANAQAKAALDAQGVDVADVVWVNKDASGMWTIYVNDLGASGAAGASAGASAPAAGDNMNATPAPAAPAK